MVFRGIYHFTQALNQANATDIVVYLTAPKNRDLGIVKSPRPKRAKPPLDLSFIPALQLAFELNLSPMAKG